MKIEIEATPTYWSIQDAGDGKAMVTVYYEYEMDSFEVETEFDTPTEAAKWIEEVLKEEK